MKLPPIVTLLRPHQWVKNGIVAAPLFFTPQAVNAGSVVIVALAILCFCAVSSAVYILNDYVDRETDREHPRKRLRPLAAGTIRIPVALTLLALLLIGGMLGAWMLAPDFAAIVSAYAVLQIAYSFVLKHMSIIDVMAIAAGFVLRLIAGAEVIDVPLSAWIILLTGQLALFIALAKRRDDVVKELAATHRASLKGYSKSFLDVALSVILGAVIVSYMIYTTDEEAMARFGTGALFYTVPFVIAGVLRYLQITLVEERSGQPTVIFLTDRFLIGCVAGWLATFGLMIYG